MASTLGVDNPFRYRGYYYDEESGLYYLNSRYYDPVTGRFINADGYLGANGDMLAYNLFAYCSNNPINYSDPTGTFKLWNAIKNFVKSFMNDYAAPDENIVDAISSAAPIAGSVITLGKGYTARIEKPHVPNDQKHVHILKNGTEVANQNDDGSPHHPGKNKPNEPPKSIKKELKKQTGWDWEKKETSFNAIDFGQVAKEYETLFGFGLNPAPYHGYSWSPSFGTSPYFPGVPIYGY